MAGRPEPGLPVFGKADALLLVRTTTKTKMRNPEPVGKPPYKMGHLPKGTVAEKLAFVHDYIRECRRTSAAKGKQAAIARDREKGEVLGRYRLLKSRSQ